MNNADKMPLRIRADELPDNTRQWALPEVGQPVRAVGLKTRTHLSAPPSVEVDSAEPQAEPVSQQEREAIIQAAQQDGFEAGRQAGYQQGLEEGKAAGHAQGLEQAQAAITAQQQLLGDLLKQLQIPLEQLNDEHLQWLTQLASAAASAVVRQQVNLDPALIRDSLTTALATLPQAVQEEQPAITVRINPADRASIEPLLTEYPGLQLHEDAEQMRGGCQLETAHSLVDDTISRRLGEVAEQLSLALDACLRAATDEN